MEIYDDVTMYAIAEWHDSYMYMVL